MSTSPRCWRRRWGLAGWLLLAIGSDASHWREQFDTRLKDGD